MWESCIWFWSCLDSSTACVPSNNQEWGNGRKKSSDSLGNKKWMCPRFRKKNFKSGVLWRLVVDIYISSWTSQVFREVHILCRTFSMLACRISFLSIAMCANRGKNSVGKSYFVFDGDYDHKYLFVTTDEKFKYTRNEHLHHWCG